MNSTSEIERQKEAAIDALRLKAFETNSDADRQAYFDAVNKWFQDRHIRRKFSARVLSALEPSAARELALEEAARNAAMYLATGFIACPRCGEDVETKNTDAEYVLRAALSYPEPSAHRETVLYEAARKAQKAIAAILASGGLESDKWWDDLVSAQQSLAAAIRALSSPDHSDAGKVEGDGWLPIESAPKDGAEILAWRKDCGWFIASFTSCSAFPLSQSEIDELDEETLFKEDWFTQWPQALRLEGSEEPTHWRPLPSAPSQEVAGS